MAQIPPRGLSDRLLVLAAVAVLGAGAVFFAMKGGERLPAQVSASQSVSSSCVRTCADGYTYLSCTAQGYPINYFQDPCWDHGGQAAGPIAASSSARSAFYCCLGLGNTCTGPVYWEGARPCPDQVQLWSDQNACNAMCMGQAGGSSSRSSSAFSMGPIAVPPPMVFSSSRSSAAASSAAASQVTGFCCITSQNHCGVETVGPSGDVSDYLVTAASCQQAGGLLWYPSTFGGSELEAFLTCNGACQAETTVNSSSRRSSSVPAAPVASSSVIALPPAPGASSSRSSVVTVTPPVTPPPPASATTPVTMASSSRSSAGQAGQGASSSVVAQQQAQASSPRGSSRASQAFSDDTFSAVSAPRSSRRQISSRPPLDFGVTPPPPVFVRSSRAAALRTFSSADAAPEERVFGGWCCVDQAQGWFYSGYAECKDGQGERRFEFGDPDVPPGEACDVESPGTCSACAACGSGLTNACDADECAWLGGDGNHCVFEPGIVGGTCRPADHCAGEACVCEGKGEADCSADLFCEWRPGVFGGECVKTFQCDQVYVCEEGVGLEQLRLFEAVARVAEETEVSICFNSRQRCDTDCL